MNEIDKGLKPVEGVPPIPKVPSPKVEGVPEDLRVRINNFLFPLVPDDLSIGEFDKLGCNIYDLICACFELNNARGEMDDSLKRASASMLRQ